MKIEYERHRGGLNPLTRCPFGMKTEDLIKDFIIANRKKEIVIVGGWICVSHCKFCKSTNDANNYIICNFIKKFNI